MIKLSLVVPCYNEEENVEAFYAETIKAFANCGFEYELVMVNDGSKDGTAKKLKELYQKHSRETHLTIVQFSRNFGKEAGILAGMKHARGDLVTFIDADLQQRPEIVLEMVKILDEHEEYDCVAAYQAQRKEGSVLTFFKNCFYKLINKLCDIDFVSGASDFRTCRRNMIEAILSMPEYFRFSKGIFSWVGFETYFMPYEVQERNAGTSKWSFWKLFQYAVEGIVGYTTAPLHLATILGMLSAGLSVLYMLVVIFQKLVFDIPISGYPTIVCLILFIGGIQLVMLGIIGEYLAKAYIQGKNRPIYIEKEVLSSEE
ncbi:MAG: glycosyltransferase family 2 protein [Lachnospiraceae bacterium]